jgi:hypothetical protein
VTIAKGKAAKQAKILVDRQNGSKILKVAPSSPWEKGKLLSTRDRLRKPYYAHC